MLRGVWREGWEWVRNGVRRMREGGIEGDGEGISSRDGVVRDDKDDMDETGDGRQAASARAPPAKITISLQDDLTRMEIN